MMSTSLSIVLGTPATATFMFFEYEYDTDTHRTRRHTGGETSHTRAIGGEMQSEHEGQQSRDGRGRWWTLTGQIWVH